MRETVTVGELARVLGESCHVLLARVLKVLGQERCTELLTEALLIEHQGGLWLENLGRKRTLGGLFLHLVRERATAEERAVIFRRAGRAPRLPG